MARPKLEDAAARGAAAAKNRRPPPVGEVNPLRAGILLRLGVVASLVRLFLRGDSGSDRAPTLSLRPRTGGELADVLLGSVEDAGTGPGA